MDTDFNDTETLIPWNQNHRNHMDSGSESAFIGSWGSSSSSSFLTPSFGSELDSNDADLDDAGAGDGEDDDFIAQLTRQMADYMLEENNENQKSNFQEPTQNQNHEQIRRSYADTVKKSIIGFQSDQNLTSNKQTQPPIQLYQVENQPRVGVQSDGSGRRGKSNESTQYMKPSRHEQMHSNSNRGVRYGKGYSGVRGASTAVGSGMRAIFLGGSGSRNVMSGTGVFLPRSATDATEQSRKKPGCSTVLVPTRVLQALEQHFNNMESVSPSTSLPHTHPNLQAKKGATQTQESLSTEHQEPKLPQEWIY